MIVSDSIVPLAFPISTADAVPRAPSWLATSRFRLNRTRFRGRNELHPKTLTVVRAASLSTAAEVRLPWTWIALLRERGDYVSALRKANSTDYGPW